MKTEDKALVMAMEAKYDQFAPKLRALQTALAEVQAHYEDYLTLRDFYGSQDWFRLRELPHADIKAGVLSEDQVYDLILTHNALLTDCLQLVTEMSKHG